MQPKTREEGDEERETWRLANMETRANRRATTVETNYDDALQRWGALIAICRTTDVWCLVDDAIWNAAQGPSQGKAGEGGEGRGEVVDHTPPSFVNGSATDSFGGPCSGERDSHVGSHSAGTLPVLVSYRGAVKVVASRVRCRPVSLRINGTGLLSPDALYHLRWHPG